MTKAELEAELENVQTELFKKDAVIQELIDDLDRIGNVLAFTEGMLDLVDHRSPIFYHDWKGYRERSLS